MLGWTSFTQAHSEMGPSACHNRGIENCVHYDNKRVKGFGPTVDQRLMQDEGAWGLSRTGQGNSVGRQGSGKR